MQNQIAYESFCDYSILQKYTVMLLEILPCQWPIVKSRAETIRDFALAI